MSKELWVGAVHKNGSITKNPLLYVKEDGSTVYRNCGFATYQTNEDVKPLWMCLDKYVRHPGIEYPQGLECVVMCSELREDICSFIRGAEAVYCMMFHGAKKFFGPNSGEYSAFSNICYEAIMRMPKVKKEEGDDDDEY